MNSTKNIFLSLGCNQGNCLENLQLAINKIADSVGAIVQISSVYKTKSWGFESADFLNICMEISSKLNAQELWKEVEKIEESLGRIRSHSNTYQARGMDIDILLFNNAIIVSKELVVPHSKMLERNFVLVPLTEIAPHFKHPLVKKNIQVCLENSTDSTEVFKTDLKLKKPLSIGEKYNYIAIEGNIGAGKTTLSNRIGEDFNARLVLERFADNPFLPKFYKDNDRYAFPLEMSFLADRYQQLSDDLAQFDLFKNLVVSDYYIFKSLIFSQITLQKDEFNLYRRMFDVMYKEITKPDLYVYLFQNTDRLMENIKKRGRDYEKDIKPAYLDKIHKGYFNFIKSQQDLNTLIIDVSNMDFVKNKEDYNTILKQIIKHNNNGK